MANRYENLKLDTVYDGEPMPVEHITWVGSGRDEAVIITTAKKANGHWIWGYCVEWASGRVSRMLPCPQLGEFATERDAILYGIGYMQMYREYFNSETVAELDKSETKYKRNKLFEK